MVSEAILGALVGGGAAVVGSYVQAQVNRQNTRDRIDAERENLKVRQQAETERRRGEYYLQKKVEALMNLYAVLAETRREYKKTADKAVFDGITQEEYDETIELYHKYEQEMDRAAVFLNDEQHETLLVAFKTIHDTNSFLNRKIDNPEQSDYSEFNLGEHNDRFDAAEETLKEEIRVPIEALDTEESHTS